MLNGVLGCAIAFQVWDGSCRLLDLGLPAPEGWEPSGGKEVTLTLTLTKP